ncbi:MAG: apolipoprotein N-acyltransferase [Nitrospirales bacterium]
MKIPATPRLLAVFLTGILYPLCFPNLDFGWLAWIVLIPLHLAIDGLSPKQSFWWGWFAGTLGFTGTVSWVITAMHSYGQVPLIISVLLMIVLASYLGLYVGIYTLGVSWFKKSGNMIICLAAPSLWVTLELLRTYLFSGFPWALLGYSQYQWLTIIQVSDITGVYGISFLIVLTNVAFAQAIGWVIDKPSKIVHPFPWQPITMTFGFLSLIFLYGVWQLDHYATGNSSATEIRVGVVQGNIDQARKWDEAHRQETVNRYDKLSRQATKNTDLLIWPESATPFFFEREPVYQQQVASIVQDTQTSLLFGSPTLRRHEDGRPYLFNSAYLLSPQGEIAGRYDKRHLVPFGEYIPLRSILFFLDKLVVGIGDFQSGIGRLTLTLPQQSNRPPLNFGVAVCFEVIFPDLVRRMAKEGADFLVTITNDAWFGDSVAPYQHFGMVVFRAVENRVAFARSANTGISGFIAPDGRILSTTPIFTQEALTGAIPLRTTTAFYSQYGDVFSWACVIILMVCGWIQRHHTHQTDNKTSHS